MNMLEEFYLGLLIQQHPHKNRDDLKKSDKCLFRSLSPSINRSFHLLPIIDTFHFYLIAVQLEFAMLSTYTLEWHHRH